MLSVLAAELQHSGLLPWGGFPLNNITRVNAKFPSQNCHTNNFNETVDSELLSLSQATENA